MFSFLTSNSTLLLRYNLSEAKKLFFYVSLSVSPSFLCLLFITTNLQCDSVITVLQIEGRGEEDLVVALYIIYFTHLAP